MSEFFLSIEDHGYRFSLLLAFYEIMDGDQNFLTSAGTWSQLPLDEAAKLQQVMPRDPPSS
jgi:hypothetical protein